MYDTMFFSFFQRYLYHTNGMLGFFPPPQPLRMSKSIVLIRLMERARARKMGEEGLLAGACCSLMAGVGGWPSSLQISGPLFPSLRDGHGDI